MFEFLVYETLDGGYGYKILWDGIVAAIQEFRPGVGGYQPMEQHEAEAEARAHVIRLGGVVNG